MIAVLGIYLFILIGFFSKKIFKEIEAKSLVLLSTYFLQPFLTLWGILLLSLNKDMLFSPFVYLLIVFVSLIFTSFFALFLKDKKDRIIASLMPLIGNTGNLGIPICLYYFGEIGASVATLINLANIFFIYLFAIIFFAKTKFSLKESIKKILKIPIIWFGILAIILNINGIRLNSEIMKILEMGAYASIVMQLLIFGISLAEIKVEEIDFKLNLITLLNKFLVLPVVSFFILKFFNIANVIKNAIMLEILMPLAITNVNLAVLFDLYPKKVALLVVVSSFVFLLLALII